MRLVALTLVWLAALLEPAQAEPISTAIATQIITATAATAAAATAIKVAVAIAVTTAISVSISLGLSALQRAVGTKKPQAGEPLVGLETSVQIGGDIARQIVVGRCGVKGHLVYHNVYDVGGKDINEFYQQVYVLSDWASEGLQHVWIDGLKYNLVVMSGPSNGFTEYQTNEAGPIMRFRFYDGTQVGADAELTGNAKPAGKWTSASVLTGMTYVIVVMQYVKGHILFQSGLPQFTFDLKGARLFDPRLSAETGGSGAHVWSNPATWTYSENPAVIAYNYQRGFYRTEQLVLGMGTSPIDMLHDTYFAAANICDENVTTTGDPEKRYRCATILTADARVPHSQHLDVILSTMAGYLYDYSGYYYLQAGAGYVPAATITDAELVDGAPISFAAKRTRAELFNRIHGQYLDAIHEFQPQSYTPQISDAGVSADGEELGRDLDLLSVPSQFQAERIAQVRLREGRRQGTAAITLGFHRQPLQAGDWLTWNSARYGNGTWRIQSRSWDPVTRTVSLELAQIDANVFSWSTADEGTAVGAAGRITTAVLMTTVAVWNVQAITVIDSSGEWPGLKFTWFAIIDPTVDAVVIEYREFNLPATTTRVSDFSPGDGFHTVTNNVFGGKEYEARATIATTPARVTTWTPWKKVNTADTIIDVGSFVDDAPGIPSGLVITSSLETLATGETQTVVRADWNDNTDPTLSYYSVEIKESSSGGNYVAFQTATSEYYWRGIRPGTEIYVRVQARSKLGNISGYIEAGPHIVAVSTVPPNAPTNFTAAGAFRTVFLEWDVATNPDLSGTEVWESTTNDRATAVRVARVSAPGDWATLTDRLAATTYYYWLRSVNTSGLFSTYEPAGAAAGRTVSTVRIMETDIQPGQITTPLMIANSILGDRIQAGSLSAAKIQSNTVISDLVFVGASGQNLGTIQANSNDPGPRVNANTTLIEPGHIQILGGTTLTSWRNGGDSTEIRGGAIAANTIAANKITIGNRGIAVANLNFYVNKATQEVFWTEGQILYTDDAGSETSRNTIAGSQATGGAYFYFYWVKDGTQVFPTTSPPTGPDRVVLATYSGGAGLNAHYGNTIIDGDRILTNTIQANRIQANSITANQLATSQLISVEAQIGNLTVGNLKIIDGAISSTTAYSSGSNNGLSLPIDLRGGSSVMIQWFAAPYNGTATYNGFSNLGFRTYWARIDGGHYDSGALAVYDRCVGAFAGPSFTWQADSWQWALEFTPPFDGTFTVRATPDHAWFMLYGITVIGLDK